MFRVGQNNLTDIFFKLIILMNLLERVKLCYTPNFITLGYLEVPGSGWCLEPMIIITLHPVKLSRVRVES